MENNLFNEFGKAGVDEDIEKVKPLIEEIIAQQKVVTDRELKVRLEDTFFPWVVGRALIAMEKEGIVRRVGYAGRRMKGIPESFFTLSHFKYSEIVGIIMEKRDVSRDINAILTRRSPAGEHAEELFRKAFESLNFKIHKRDASEFRGRSVKGVKGKEPPNLDFIVERDGVVYGVDIKNWIRYEYETRSDVIFKVNLALQLKIVPFIIARYVDKDTLYREIICKGGICYRYKTLLIPPSFDSLAMKAVRILGYPVLATDWLPKFKVDWIKKLHEGFLSRKC